MYKSWFQAQPRRTQSLIYFCRGVGAQAVRFNTFSRHKFSGATVPVSRKWKEQTTPNFGRTQTSHRLIDTPRVCFRYQVHCFVLESASKGKCEPNSLFDPCENQTRSIISVSKGRSVIFSPANYSRFTISCSVTQSEHVKCDWCRKSRQNCALLASSWHPVKCRGGMRKISRVNFTSSAQGSNLRDTSDGTLLGRLQVGCQKKHRGKTESLPDYCWATLKKKRQYYCLFLLDSITRVNQRRCRHTSV